jgi:hypothetical protein
MYLLRPLASTRSPKPGRSSSQMTISYLEMSSDEMRDYIRPGSLSCGI